MEPYWNLELKSPSFFRECAEEVLQEEESAAVALTEAHIYLSVKRIRTYL